MPQKESKSKIDIKDLPKRNAVVFKVVNHDKQECNSQGLLALN